jgi:hypothetical protein
MKKLLVAVSVVWFMSGCAVMHFKQNNEPTTSGDSYKKMHHNLAWSLYEISPPVKPSEFCGDTEWNSVTTKTSFLTGLIGSVDYVIGLNLWTPQDVVVTCSSEETN